MKNMKKLFSLALALVMMMALVVTAGATTGASITITDAYPGNTYNAYKILDVESVGDGTQSYKINSSWVNFFKTGAAGAGTLEGIGENKDDLSGYVTWKGAGSDTTDLANFAKAALEYATENKIDPAGTANSSTRTDENYKTPEDVTITLTELGWYLIDTTNGSLCSLTVNAPDATIKEKNPAPEIKKTNDNVNNTKQIGDTVTFTITVTAQEGAQAYVVHDVMGAGLTLNKDSIAVTGAEKGEDKDYTVTTEGLTDDCTFEVAFTKAYLDKITAKTEIVITYSAVINSSAVTESIGNKTQLKYGDNDFTPWKQVNDETPNPEDPNGVYGFSLVKTNSDNDVIDGAVFTMKRQKLDNDGNPVVDGDNKPVYEEGNVKFSYNEEKGEYTVDPTGSEDITAGNVKILGLGKVSYLLTEKTAPDGYNKLTDPRTVTITGDNYATITEDNASTEDNEAKVQDGVQVINQTGTELPSTGGIGTTIFTVTGAILMIGAAVLFLTKKRSEA